MIGVAVLGSTGSVGRQALDVIRRLGNQFRVVGLAAGHNASLLIEQAGEFAPDLVCVGDEEAGRCVREAVPGCTAVHCGSGAVEDLARHPSVDVVVAAIGGFAGLRPALAAAEAGKRIALASKEALVVAGGLVLQAAARNGARVIPVDSEHSAIFQCIEGQRSRPSRIILTASGGPFRLKSKDELRTVTPQEALRHPNWRMGAKVTVDSATLMNKGLEVIEAHVLFGVAYDAIDVVIHPQSIIHSMVEMVDGSVLAQMAAPDMRLPISYALAYPDRAPAGAQRLDFTSIPPLTFERPDVERFPALALSYRAGKSGGLVPAVLNAADEVVVGRFLGGAIPFTAIPEVIGSVMDAFTPAPGIFDLEAITRADAWAREQAARACDRIELREERR
ncbi:MAG: 1-deoxy-D-xylulose-5-phosphate reductoisomerase [Firmicutes bacterium]|nr:1-deoxy-D-xylulose-5-phosphate reductoisomerase [Bacillota bacterium]